MATKNPYGANYPTLVTPKTIESDMSKAAGKAKMRFPNKPLGVSQASSTTGNGSKSKAYTPGGPEGS